MRVSKADRGQGFDLHQDALLAAGVPPQQLLGGLYEDRASGRRDDHPGLATCLKALRQGDVLVVWKFDWLGRGLRHLINTVHDLTTQGTSLKVLTGHAAAFDTATAAGKLVFGIFAALAEFERELIVERTRTGLAAARARGRKRGAPFKMTPPNSGWPWPRWASRKPRSAPYARSWGSRGKRSTAMSARRASYTATITNSSGLGWLAEGEPVPRCVVPLA
jgi:DNA invertase Pin-like site-specific DNA recombinase